MTIETLRIELNRAEGAVIRLLGLIERRGFAVTGMIMPPPDPAANSSLMEITVQVEPRQDGRCIDNLACQLRKLWDVETVSLREAAGPNADPMPMSAPPDQNGAVTCAV